MLLLIYIGINIFEIVENKGVGFTAEQVMGAVLDYTKVPVTIQSYSRDQSNSKATGTPSDPNDTRRAAATFSTS